MSVAAELFGLGRCMCSAAESEIRDPNLDLLDERLSPHTTRPGEERGLITYSADLTLPLVGPPLRSGEVWYLGPEDGNNLSIARLTLHANGMSIETDESRSRITIAWSPFSLVQACRLHTAQADEALPWLRLFKVSVFHHGSTHIFATHGETADKERAHWLADVARALRVLTQSLFPQFALRTMPLPGAGWTATRLLAGYLCLCDDQGVSLIYAELHSHFDGSAMFAGYEDEYCDCLVLRLSIDLQTSVTERVGVDCSCFSLAGRHLTARSCAEKTLWLRAVSNVKVKLRHSAENPTATDLMHYRASVLEHARRVEIFDEDFTRSPLLPRRPQRSGPKPVKSDVYTVDNATAHATAPPFSHFPAAPAASVSGPSQLHQLMPPRRPPSLDHHQEMYKDGPPPVPIVDAVPVLQTGGPRAQKPSHGEGGAGISFPESNEGPGTVAAALAAANSPPVRQGPSMDDDLSMDAGFGHAFERQAQRDAALRLPGDGDAPPILSEDEEQVEESITRALAKAVAASGDFAHVISLEDNDFSALPLQPPSLTRESCENSEGSPIRGPFTAMPDQQFKVMYPKSALSPPSFPIASDEHKALTEEIPTDGISGNGHMPVPETTQQSRESELDDEEPARSSSPSMSDDASETSQIADAQAPTEVTPTAEATNSSVSARRGVSPTHRSVSPGLNRTSPRFVSPRSRSVGREPADARRTDTSRREGSATPASRWRSNSATIASVRRSYSANSKVPAPAQKPIPK